MKKKKKGITKWTDESDDAYDRKYKIKEGSRKDMMLDRKRGVPEDDDMKMIKRIRRATKSKK